MSRDYFFSLQGHSALGQFTVHLEGVVVNTQVSAKLWHLFQVRAIRAIILTSDCDVLPVEHMGMWARRTS